MILVRLASLAALLAGTAALAQPASLPAGKMQHHHTRAAAMTDTGAGCRTALFVPAGKLRTYGRDPSLVRCEAVEVARAERPAGGMERSR